MSRYTTELRFVVDQLSKEGDLSRKLSEAGNAIFADLPVYLNKTHFEAWKKKFLRHYYFDEIGLETYGRWAFEVQTLYLELVESYERKLKTLLAILESDTNKSYREIYTESNENRTETNGKNERKTNETKTGSRTTSSEAETKSESGSSDTPQGELYQVKENRYMSDYSYTNGSGKNSAKETNETKTDSTDSADSSSETTGTGKRGYEKTVDMQPEKRLEMLTRIKSEIDNYDLRFIKEFSHLFMQVF